MDIKFMKRALDLAEKGIGHTNPNPLVGAVIVKDGRIIGEGYHQYYGGPHAEVNAFANATATEAVEGATMYVTLEPCSHYGKTPPCALAIVEKKIKKVVIGLIDPNPLVSGKGIEILRSNGIEVIVGVLEEEGRKLNEIFLKYITAKQPFCILKTAMTIDGKIATHTGDSKWITNEQSREFVHQLRHRVSGIMVGIGTVLADDPMLNTRLKSGRGKDPHRIIIDSNGRLPLDARLLQMQSNAATIVAVTEGAPKIKLRQLEEKGAQIIVVPSKDGRVDLSWLMQELCKRNIDSVLLEGGGALNFSALQQGIVDKIFAFIAPKIIGGKDAKTPVEGEGMAFIKDAIMLHDLKIQSLDNDIMLEGYIRKEEG